ncbi:MAG: sigma 54-interacting transcriptional regulator [Syntrophaceticus schinkii]
MAESGIPEPKVGLVTEAHGGVLFIDEIGDVDPILQNKLLKVLEDKKVVFESSYYEPSDPMIPEYIKTLFEEGAPADFVLIGATTREPQQINPAFRSRCAEIFFDCLTPLDIQKVLRQAARKLGVTLGRGLAEAISEYTIEARKATNILVDASSVALSTEKINKFEEYKGDP